MSFKSPSEIAKAACAAASNKSSMGLHTILPLGFLAGVYIAFGGYMMTVVTQDASTFVGVGISKLIGGIVFALGLMLVVVGGAELFTGNCLMPIGCMSGCISFKKLLRSWAWVYAANFAGSVAAAWLIYHTGLVNGAVGLNALSIAAAKSSLAPSAMFFRGILCNWLVVLAVWTAFAAEDVVSKYICCLLPISGFVAMGFEHSVANMYFISLGMMIKSGSPDVVALFKGGAAGLASLNMCGYFSNLLFVTAGNIVGGAFFVAVFYFTAYSKVLKNKN